MDDELQSVVEEMRVRESLRDTLSRYCMDADAATNPETALNYFCDDAILDLTAVGLPCFSGRSEIAEFFRMSTEGSSHTGHFLCNFTVDQFTTTTARCRAYVIGMGVRDSKVGVQIYLRYDIDFEKLAGEWKFRHFSERFVIPPDIRFDPNFALDQFSPDGGSAD